VPRAPSLTSFVGGIHAKSFSPAVASSIRPPGAYSDMKFFHVYRHLGKILQGVVADVGVLALSFAQYQIQFLIAMALHPMFLFDMWHLDLR
jgi:hypothetical protein